MLKYTRVCVYSAVDIILAHSRLFLDSAKKKKKKIESDFHFAKNKLFTVVFGMLTEIRKRPMVV